MEWATAPQYTHLLRTRAYLSALPAGLSSYPQCCGKTSVWRNILELTDTTGLSEQLPEELAVLLTPPLVHGSWLPVAHSFAGHLLLRDCLFTSDEAICDHFRRVDRQLLAGPLYRVLFAVASPSMMVHASDRRFGALFKGIAFRTESTGKDQVRIELTYPPALVPPLVGRLYLIAFEVAVELAGGEEVRGKLLQQRTDATHYELSWR